MYDDISTRGELENQNKDNYSGIITKDEQSPSKNQHVTS